MFTSTVLKIGFVIALVSAAAVQAATFGDMPGSPSVLPPESTQRFLGQVRDFGNGQPSPVILYSTRGVGEAANSPGRTITEGPSVLIIPGPPPRTPLSGTTMPGAGTILLQPVAPYPVGGPISR